MDNKQSELQTVQINDDIHNGAHKLEFELETRGDNTVSENKTDNPKASENHPVSEYCDRLDIFRKKHHQHLIYVRNFIFLAGYFVYFGFAVKHLKGDEKSWRLVGFTIFGSSLIAWRLLNKTSFGTNWTNFVDNVFKEYSKGKRSKVIRWFLYIAMTTFMVVYVIVFVARKSPENLRSLMGIFGFTILLFLYSNNKRKINWHTVYWGMALQFIMALIILKTTWGASIISWVGTRLQEFIATAKAGSVFAFGEKYTDHPFAFGAMVQAFCMIVGISVLTYLGVIKFIVNTLGTALAFMLQVTPAEGMNSVGNIFLHIPESVMLVQEYLFDMTPSQLFITYAGGLTTVGGVSLVIFMASGVPAAPLVAASAMSAPAALAASKLVFPSHDDEVVPKAEGKTSERPSILRMPTSLADSVILGIQQCVTLVVQAVAFIVTFIIILEFLNNVVSWFGERVGEPDFTLEVILSYVFYPCAFLMGARAEDCMFIGKLLGIRTFSFAVVAFPKLGPVIQNGIVFRQYVSEGVNNTWSAIGEDVFLDNWNQTLPGGVIDMRSEIIATYSLCGSASLALMGFILGSYSVMMPNRSQEVTKHIMRAMVVGTVASYFTACFAGLLFEEGVGYS